MKKLLIVACLSLIGCNNYSGEKLPKEAGLVFRVLVESKSIIDISECSDAPVYRIEKSQNYSHRIFAGSYFKYFEATELKSCMRRAGYPRAWVVAFQDGKRIELSEVLQ